MQIKTLFATATLLLLSLAVCASDSKASQDKTAAVQVSHASIRALLPGQSTTAAFLTLTNTTATTLHLNELSSSLADKVEIHHTVEQAGTMKMRKRDSFSIAAGETAVFAPGQDHIMFIGLKKPLKEGDSADLRLCFGNFCKKVTLQAVSVLHETDSNTNHQHH